MARSTRPLLLLGAVLLTAACTRVVDGTALPGSGAGRKVVHGVDVDVILLDQPRMRAITGAGENLNVIPSMDGTNPVDIDALADTTPQECRFLYAETATFGPDIEEFHKTTFQDPPDGALISEGAATYRDAPPPGTRSAPWSPRSETARAAPPARCWSATGRPARIRCTSGPAAADATTGCCPWPCSRSPSADSRSRSPTSS